MADQQDKLRQSLDRLQAQLDAMRTAHPDVAAHLSATLAEARSMISGGAAMPAKNPSIVERLSGAVLKYEAAHPSLAMNLGSLIDALGQMGI